MEIGLNYVPVIVKEMKHCLGLDRWNTYNPGLRTCTYYRNYVFFSDKYANLMLWNLLAEEGLACCKGTCFSVTEKGISWLENIMGVPIYSEEDSPERAKENTASFEVSFPWGIKVASSDLEGVREEIDAYFMNLLSVDEYEYFDIDELSVQLKNGEEIYE